MDGYYLVFFGILFLLYSNGTITLTQLFIMLALVSTANFAGCNNNSSNSST